MKEFSNIAYTAFIKHLKEGNFPFSFDKEDGVFTFINFCVNGIVNSFQYLIEIEKDVSVIYGFYPLSVAATDNEKTASMSLFLHMINYEMTEGNFEFSPTGTIILKYYIHSLKPRIITKSIISAQYSFSKYGAGLVDIIVNGSTPEEAMKSCENIPDELLTNIV